MQVTVEILSLLMSAGSFVGFIIFSVLNNRRLSKIDIESNTRILTHMQANLDNVSKKADKIDASIDIMHTDYQGLRDKVIRIETRLEGTEERQRKNLT